MDSDSDFYGDEDTISHLNSRVESFDVAEYWKSRGALSNNPPDKPTPSAIMTSPASQQLHNPYAGLQYAWQLTESVDAFLARLPPETTPQLEDTSYSPSSSSAPSLGEADGVPWIYICNPFIGGRRAARSAGAQLKLIRGCEDEGPEDARANVIRFKEGGDARLAMLSESVDHYTVGRGGPDARPRDAAAARELAKDRELAVTDILMLAHLMHVQSGKWMLFVPPSDVNAVWAVVAHATANNELGIAAKVAPRPPRDSGGGLGRGDRNQKLRVVCIYTADFRDKNDVGRVLRRLRELGLVKNAGGGRQIYYKTDAFTYLGLGSGNKWGIKASLYNSAEIFAHIKR